MRIILSIALFCSTIFLCAGCATTTMASAEMDSIAKSFTPPSGLSNLYLMRSGSIFAGSIAFNIMVDGKYIGTIVPATFHLLYMSPGRHFISVSSNENSVQTQLVVEGNKNYFYEVSTAIGLITARVSINKVSEEEGKRLVKNCSRAESIAQ